LIEDIPGVAVHCVPFQYNEIPGPSTATQMLVVGHDSPVTPVTPGTEGRVDHERPL
jgi:hypothetical protein